MSYLNYSVWFLRFASPKILITSTKGMSKVATSISTEVIEVAVYENLTLNRGTCTIIYIPLIRPQTCERAPFIATFIIILAPVAACSATFPLFCILLSPFLFFFLTSFSRLSSIVLLPITMNAAKSMVILILSLLLIDYWKLGFN